MSKWMNRFEEMTTDTMKKKVFKMAQDDFQHKKLNAFLVEIRQQTRGFRKEMKAWCEGIYHQAFRGY